MDADKKNLNETPVSRKPASAQDIKVATAESTLDVEVMAWLEVHKKQLVALLVVAVGALVVGVIYSHYSAQRDLSANEALLALRAPLFGPEHSKTVPAEKFAQVASQYAGTAAARRAVLLEAEAFFTEGQYDKAREIFGRFLNENPGDSLSPQADYGIAACWEAAGKNKEALEAYENVHKRYAQDSGLATQSRLAIGRINEGMTNWPAAYTAYKDILESSRGSYSSSVEEAAIRMGQLEKAHPELAALRMTPPPTVQPVVSTGTNRPVVRGTNVPPQLKPVPLMLQGTNRGTRPLSPSTAPKAAAPAPAPK